MYLGSLLLLLLVVAGCLYVIQLLALDPRVTRILQVLVLLVAILWVLSAFGVLDVRVPR